MKYEKFKTYTLTSLKEKKLSACISGIFYYLQIFYHLWQKIQGFIFSGFSTIKLKFCKVLLFNMKRIVGLREGPASQVQSTLCRWKNFPPLIQNSDPPKLAPQNTVSILAFRITLTHDVKNVWFGRHVAVCVQKRHTNYIFGCSWFQKFNFDCLLLKLLICSPATEKNI